MKNILIPLLALMLMSCVTVKTPQPTVTTSKPCHPSSELMVKEKPIDPISASVLTQQEQMAQWLNDIARLNGLIIDKNALVDHVNKFCQ